MMLNKKHHLKSGKAKDKKNGFQWENNIGNQKREMIDEKSLLNISILFFWWNKSKSERKMKKRQKLETKRKKERQEGRKKDKSKRETEKEKQKKGEAKKG